MDLHKAEPKYYIDGWPGQSSARVTFWEPISLHKSPLLNSTQFAEL